jgi:hypothetical protein
MRNFAWLALCTATAACATTSTPGDPAGGRERVIASGVQMRDGSAVLSATTPGAQRTTIAAPPATVLPAVKTVYGALSIPITLDDAATGRIGNANFWKARRLDGDPLSRFVSCGEGLTGPRADSYRVYLSLVTTARPGPDGDSVLSTELIASASDVAAGNPDRIPCGTTGVLESRIAERVKANLSK